MILDEVIKRENLEREGKDFRINFWGIDDEELVKEIKKYGKKKRRKFIFYGSWDRRILRSGLLWNEDREIFIEYDFFEKFDYEEV